MKSWQRALGNATLAVLLCSMATASAFGQLHHVKLSPPLPEEQCAIAGFQLSPDESYVVLQTHIHPIDLSNLYSVPLEGGNAERLNAVEFEVESFYPEFAFTRDSSTVIYSTRPNPNTACILFSIPVGGGERIPLLDQDAFGTQYGRWVITPDDSTLIYSAERYAAGVEELFRAPMNGGPPVSLLPTLPLHSHISLYEITPDGNRVVYVVYYDNNLQDIISSRLFSVPIVGGAPVQLHPDTPPGEHVLHFTLNKTGTHALYVANHKKEAEDGYQLYSVPVAGGASVHLSDGLAPWRNVSTTADGMTVICLAKDNVYAIPINGGAPINLSTGLPNEFEVVDLNYLPQLTRDESRLLYLAGTASFDTLYSVSLGGGIPVPLSGGLSVDEFKISPDGTWAVFEARPPGSGQSSDLYAAPIQGGPITRLNPEVTHRHHVESFVISPDGQSVLYVADVASDDLDELFLVSIQGGPSHRISIPIEEGGVWPDFTLTRDGGTVVYLASNRDGLHGDVYATTFKFLLIDQHLFVSGARGNDETGSGSLRHPYQTIARATVHAAAYAEEDVPVTIHIDAGVYAEAVALPHYVSLAGTYILDPGKVVLEGSLSLGEGSIARNLSITPSENDAEALVNAVGVTAWLHNCILRGADATGLLLDGTLAGTRVTLCQFTGLAEGIVADNAAAGVVTRCLFENITGAAVRNLDPSGDGNGVLALNLGDSAYPLLTGHNRFPNATLGTPIVANASPDTLEAEMNVWGAATFLVQERMSGNVDIEPSLAQSLFSRLQDLLTVIVDESTGQRINNAVVSIAPAVYPPATADENGAYAFEMLAAGDYVLHVEAPGFAPRTVEAAPGKGTMVSIELTPEEEEGRPNASSADADGDNVHSLAELLRQVQMYNAFSFACGFGTEDGYELGDGNRALCAPHTGDYAPQDWQFGLSEILRQIQLFNMGTYAPCADSEDGFCAASN